MSDLKARLRNGISYFDALNDAAKASGLSPYKMGSFAGEDIREAADRIAALEEKLRVAREGLAKLVDAVSPGTLQVDELDIGEVARTTLQSIGDENE